jgi:hypothetical protein
MQTVHDPIHHTFKPLLCISTVLLIGIGLTSFSWNRVRTDQLLDQRNSVIEGKVINGWITKGQRGGQWSTLEVEYQPASHPLIKREFDADRATYEAGLETRKVAVTYFPEDPGIARVTRFETTPFQILMGFGGLITLGGFVGLGHFIKSRRKTNPAC